MKPYHASHGMWATQRDRTLVGLSKDIYHAIARASTTAERTIVGLRHIEALRLKTWRGEAASKELLLLHLGGLVSDGWLEARGTGWCVV